MLAKIKRVLRPDGLLKVATPAKLFNFDIWGHKDTYHVEELYLDEFKALIGRSFANHRLLFHELEYSMCYRSGRWLTWPLRLWPVRI